MTSCAEVAPAHALGACGAGPPTQLTFDWLGLETPATTPTAATLRPAQRESARRARIHAGRAAAAVMQIPLDLLNQPMLDLHGHGLSKALLEIQEDFGDIDVDDDAAGPERAPHARERRGDGHATDWSDQAVAQLHEGLLLYSLAALGGQGNGNEKRRFLAWIFAPDVYAWSKRTNARGQVHYRPIYAVDIPFTFQRCCALMGFNRERLHEGLNHILRKAGIHMRI